MNPTKQIEMESYEAPVIEDITPISVVMGQQEEVGSNNGNDDESEPGGEL